MDSAIDCTCAEFTGSGNDATAASNAISMMLIVSGGKDAFEKSFIFQNSPSSHVNRKGILAREFVKDAAAARSGRVAQSGQEDVAAIGSEPLALRHLAFRQSPRR